MTYMQKSAVEASSLSSLASIASQPPSNPYEPVPPPALPLVLYIARIPGSQDVFLTPIKPREKVVTAEDVRSSLYYVHISDQDHAEVFKAPRPSSVRLDAPEMLSASPQDYRAIMSAPPLPARTLGQSLPTPYPAQDHSTLRVPEPSRTTKVVNRITRKPVLPSTSNNGSSLLPTSTTDLGLPVLPPRPLPALPGEQNIQSSLHADNVRLLRHSEHSEDANPYVRKYEPATGLGAWEASDSAPGTLTLIRRDPGSSEQWNVASIYDPPVHEVSSRVLSKTTAARRVKKSGSPLYLDLTNPGYAAFVDRDRSQSRTSTSSGSSDPEVLPEGIFRRRLYMPGSRHAEHDYGRRLLGSENSSNSSNSDMRRSMQESTSHHPIAANNTAPSLDRRAKGYAFTSPWGGHCEFTTGVTGKSLKCAHSLGRHSTMDVSELRFNLPTKSQPDPGPSKRSSYFSHQRHESLMEWEGGVDPPSIVIGEDGRIDRSLGQEKAGGGFGGKQAKLGKLIIEPEGLKMLDLLVAANIGLWWRAYERS